jgi:hypothetical protein
MRLTSVMDGWSMRLQNFRSILPTAIAIVSTLLSNHWRLFKINTKSHTLMIRAVLTIISIPEIHNYNLMVLYWCLVHNQVTLLPYLSDLLVLGTLPANLACTQNIFSLLLPEVDWPKGYQRFTNQWWIHIRHKCLHVFEGKRKVAP